MKKMKTLFTRQFDGHKIKSISPEISEGCDWVFDEDTISTRKLDGSAVMIGSNGVVYKRYDCKKGRKAPDEFMPCCDPDPVTGHWPGWVPAGDDKIINEALENTGIRTESFIYSALTLSGIEYPLDQAPFFQTTFELVGPKVNGNNDGFPVHMLMKHGSIVLDINKGYKKSDWAATREEILFDKVKQYLEKNCIEGIVFHGSGGKMCKIKRSDFGLQWGRERK